MRAVVRWLALPVLIATSVVGVLLAISVRLPIVPVLAAGGAIYAGVVLLLERWFPYAQEWQRPKGDVPTDLAHLVVTGGLIEFAPALGFAPPAAAALWPSSWPLAAQVVLALLATELLDYWTHRLLHGPLWRFHAVHHSAPRLYWVNSWRLHPVEGLLYWCCTVVPLLAIGAPPVPLMVVWSATTVFRMVQHSNVDVRLGPLNWVLAGPELHRWHHSRDRSESEANYGNALIVWDVVFGTRRLPGRAPPLEVGLAGKPYPSAYVEQILAPFRGLP
jgi:sterol desaturase/sphingolipid hydroxylase (fatty acid hydroxylase superfamily)